MKKMRALSLLLALLMTLAACGGKSDDKGASNEGGSNQTANVEDPKLGGDIVIATQVDFITMDPADANDTLSYSGQKSMLEGLFSFDQDMKVINVLAESYTASEDATEYKIKLREGISFSDGTPFNAEAVKANLDRLADQTQGLKRNTLFNMVESTTADDDYNVTIKLNRPFGAFINTLAHPAGMMISPKALAEYGKEVSQHPVGTGPFVFVSWNPGESMKVEKNPNYWGGEVKYNSITYKPVTENGTRIAMLQSKEADLTYPMPTELLQSVEGSSDLTVETIPSMVVRYVTMNNAKKPFDDIRVRHAINYAIDKEAYNQVVYNGHAKTMESLIADTVQFFKANTPYEYNVEKAKELLAEAGYPDGFTAKLWTGNATTAIKIGQFLQQQLAEVGITLNVENLETGTLNDKVFNVAKGSDGSDAEIEMYAIGWSPSTGDADWGLRPLAATESFPPASFNAAYYSNAEFDQAIQDALNTADPNKRSEAYARAQDIVWKDAPMVWLCNDELIYAHAAGFTGVTVLPDGAFNYANTYTAK